MLEVALVGSMEDSMHDRRAAAGCGQKGWVDLCLLVGSG